MGEFNPNGTTKSGLPKWKGVIDGKTFHTTQEEHIRHANQGKYVDAYYKILPITLPDGKRVEMKWLNAVEPAAELPLETTHSTPVQVASEICGPFASKDQMIWTCGIVNSAVRQAGGVPDAEFIHTAARNAVVAWERLQENPESPPVDMNDDIPF